MTRIWCFVASLALSAVACNPAADSSSPPYGDDISGGKADEPATEEVPANEPLASTALRTLLCDEISATAALTNAEREAFERDCQEHSFTVTRLVRSTLYAHLDDGQPITLEMNVEVEAAQGQWSTRLVRQWSDHRFTWSAEMVPDDDQIFRRFVENLVDEMGEYFSPDEAPDKLRALEEADVPPRIYTLADEYLTRVVQDMEGDNSAYFGGEGPWWAIVNDDGVVAGYVVEIQYSIDSPLFDGGGVTLYYDRLGNLVRDVEWFG